MIDSFASAHHWRSFILLALPPLKAVGHAGNDGEELKMV